MRIDTLWEFPVPSTNLCGDVRFIFPGANAWLFYEYFGYDDPDRVYNSGIKFKHVQVHRHANEKFASLLRAYDKIVEVCDSEWIEQLVARNSEIAAYWNIKHYAIYLDSNGLYEFAANGFEILEVKEGELQWDFPF
jgi:uncharacterized protein YegP (UPF0339 family)